MWLVALLLSVSTALGHPGGHAVGQESDAAVAQAPCELELRLRRARAWRSDGEFDHAEEELHVARRCHPDADVVWLERGLLQLARGDASGANAELSLFLDRAGPHGVALLARSRARHATGDLVGASADLETALDHLPTPRPEHYLNLTRLLAAQQRTDEALAVARRGVEDVGRVGSLVRTVAVLESR